MARTEQRRAVVSAVLVGAGSLLIVASVAMAASVDPVVVEKNPTCADLGFTFITKFDPPTSGTQEGVTLTMDGSTIVGSWSSTEPLHAVIVKGGPEGVNVYEYPEGSTGDTVLTAPLNPNSGQLPDVSHVTFCLGSTTPEPSPSPTVEPTETPTVEPTVTESPEVLGETTEQPETKVLPKTLAKTGVESWLLATSGAAMLMIGFGLRSARPRREEVAI